MRVDQGMSCGDIRKNLKNFFEDLLSEGEYEAFVLHLDVCASCAKYVRSFGDLSNQIWRLGEVPVPQDLADTALYQLRHPSPKPALFKKGLRPIGGFALLGVAVVLVGIFLSREPKVIPETTSSKMKPAASKAQTSIAVTQEIMEETDFISSRGVQSTFRDVSASSSLDVSTQKSASETERAFASDSALVSDSGKMKQTQGKSLSAGAGLLMSQTAPQTGREVSADESSSESEPPPTSPEHGMTTPSLHWHALYSDGADVLRIKEKKRLLQEELIAYAAEAAALKKESQSLDASSPQDLALIKKEVEKLQAESELFAADSRRLDAELAQALHEQELRQARHQQKVIESLKFLGVTVESQPEDNLLFQAGGQRILKVLQDLYSLYLGYGTLEDFTQEKKIEPYEDQRVSIYVQKTEGVPGLHWHLSVREDQEERFLEMVEELEGSCVYRQGRYFVFHVPKKELNKLRAKTKALRGVLTEYGKEESPGTVLSTAPATLSVFFLEEKR